MSDGHSTGAYLTLGQMADALVGTESIQMLLMRLEELMEHLGTLPARLYLADTNEGVFYPASTFGDFGEEDDDIPIDVVLMDRPPRHYPLYQHGDVVGCLVTRDKVGESVGSLRQLAVILGPAIIGVHQQEVTLKELRQVHQQMGRLVSAGRLLKHLDMEVLLVEILQAVLEAVRGQVGAIMTIDEAENLIAQVSWGLRDDHIDGICMRDGTRLVDFAFDEGRAMRLDAEGMAEELDLSGLDGQLNGVLVLVLTSGDRKHGVVLLANPDQDFTEESEKLALTVCDMAAIALDNASLVKATVDRERMRHDMEVARQVQSRMLPDGGMETGPFKVLGLSNPSEETGGDYFTYLERDGKLIALIGDVTGHGIGAALFTTVAHAIIQYQFDDASTSLEEVLKTLNQGLYHTRSGRFMTMAILEFDPKAMTINFASAGHNPVLWIHQGEVKWLESTGMPLGILSGNEVPEDGGHGFAPGDVILLYTDGITEAPNPAGEQLGEDALGSAVLRLAPTGDPEAILNGIEHLLEAWLGGGRVDDDVTMVAVTIGNPESP